MSAGGQSLPSGSGVRPGAGVELYRGLGSVVLGGLAVSTIFTVFLIPCLLMFFIRMEGRHRQTAVADPVVAK